ncbi:MAG: hypothetical protein VYA86_05895 [Candidatus Thermoplasmatota archaeon]|nr:hypothetical protein [Candidatus Thermoplasmatota archaeon]
MNAVIGTGWDVVLANLAGVLLALWLAKRLSIKMEEQTVKLGEMNSAPKVVKEAMEISAALDNGQANHDRERLKEYDATLNEFKEAARAGVTVFADQFPALNYSVESLANSVVEFKQTLGSHAAYLQQLGDTCVQIEQSTVSRESVQNIADIANENTAHLGALENSVSEVQQRLGQGIGMLNTRLEHMNEALKRIQEMI